ncbi:Copia protein [Araneus ventricosus]|uniref:Copia protein n=1 Tax=Araneus ventricosus TaxID=182803 RepID=A0A4Y2AIP8_ARAVE|nr:Copia protein [Araneus ventricosus]
MDAELKYCIDQFDGANFAVWARRIESIFVAKNLDKFLNKEADETKENEVSASKKDYALMLSSLSDKVLLSLSDENICASTVANPGYGFFSVSHSKQPQRHSDKVSVSEGSRLETRFSRRSVVYGAHCTPRSGQMSSRWCGVKAWRGYQLRFLTTVQNDNVRPNSPRVSSELDVNCNKKGHIARFCDKTVVCHHCGKLGHKKRNCRNLTRKNPPFKEEEAAAVSFVVGEREVKKFIVDSGATSHMCSQSEWFEELKPSSRTVSCAAKSSLLEVVSTGVIRGRLKNGQEIVLTNVLFIPELNGNLISVKQIQKAGYSVLFKDNKAIVKGKDKIFVLCELNSKGQYVSDFIPTVSNTFVAETEDAELWHRRLGHFGNHALRKLGLPTSDSFCENCVLAKQSAEPIGKGNRRRESTTMRMIPSDLCGSVEPITLSGERYVLTFVDDYSRFCEVRLIKTKSDIALEFKKFLKVNDTVKRIRCDNAKEYVSGELQNIARNAGVEIGPSPPFTPQLNGVAERMNRTLFDKARAMLYDSKLPKNCWGYAIQAVFFLAQ